MTSEPPRSRTSGSSRRTRVAVPAPASPRIATRAASRSRPRRDTAPGSKLLAPACEAVDVEPTQWRIVTSKRGHSGPITTLRLEPYTRRIGCGVEGLIGRAMIRRAGDTDGNRDPWRRGPRSVRERGDHEPRRAAPLGDIAGRRSRCAKQRDQLVSAGMRNQLAFPEIGARKIEDGAQHASAYASP